MSPLNKYRNIAKLCSTALSKLKVFGYLVCVTTGTFFRAFFHPFEHPALPQSFYTNICNWSSCRKPDLSPQAVKGPRDNNLHCNNLGVSACDDACDTLPESVLCSSHLFLALVSLSLSPSPQWLSSSLLCFLRAQARVYQAVKDHAAF